jgi:hypothetical protein
MKYAVNLHICLPKKQIPVSSVTEKYVSPVINMQCNKLHSCNYLNKCKNVLVVCTQRAKLIRLEHKITIYSCSSESKVPLPNKCVCKYSDSCRARESSKIENQINGFEYD